MRAFFVTSDRLAPRSGLSKMVTVHRKALERRLRITAAVADGVPLAGLADAIKKADVDVAVFAVSWEHAPDEVIAAARAIRDRVPRTDTVFFDWYDSTSSPHFGVLPYVDVYAKAQVLRDFSWYEADLRGGYVFTDFLSQQKDINLDGWFASVPDRKHAGKVVVGWSTGAARTYRRLLTIGRTVNLPWRARTIDLHCRLGLGTGDSWYRDYRQAAVATLEPLRGEFSLTGAGVVSRRKYWLELLRSKVVFSPFGWGELCYRDFEAMCCGCLLLKPDVSHLRTSPAVFEEFETYVPVKWDHSDLVSRAREFLEDPIRARRIALEGQRRLGEYFKAGGLLGDIARVLQATRTHVTPHYGQPARLPWRASAAVLGGSSALMAAP